MSIDAIQVESTIERCLRLRVRFDSEDGDLYGMGHQNKTAFAAWARNFVVKARLFDADDRDDLEYYNAANVHHCYMMPADHERNYYQDGEYMVLYDTPGAHRYPITVLYA